MRYPYRYISILLKWIERDQIDYTSKNGGSVSSPLDCEEFTSSLCLLHQHGQDLRTCERILDLSRIFLEGRDGYGSNWLDIFRVSFFNLMCSISALKDCVIGIVIGMSKFEFLYKIVAGFEVERFLMTDELNGL